MTCCDRASVASGRGAISPALPAGQSRRPAAFKQANQHKNGYHVGKETEQQFSTVAGHAAFSRRTPLNFLPDFLTAINLPSVFVPLGPGGLSHEFAFELSSLTDGTDAPVVSSGFVACHFSSVSDCDVG